MGKKLWMFPGQGSQEVGMGKVLHDSHKEVQDLFDKASHITKRDIRKIVFEGPKETLDKTSNTQVAILVVSLGILAVYLKRHHEEPDYVAGHSVGEIAAMVAGDAISEDDAISLVFERGLAMEEAGKDGTGGMAAILGVPDTEVEALAQEHGLVVANYNIPNSQSVVSGKRQRVDAVLEIVEKRGRNLAVTIAAHAPEMGDAVQRVEDKLHAIKTIDHLGIPAIANRTGQIVTRLGELELPLQLVRPVRWGQGIEAAVREGVTEFYEVGPNSVLTSMVKRHLKGRPGVVVRQVEEDLLDN